LSKYKHSPLTGGFQVIRSRFLRTTAIAVIGSVQLTPGFAFASDLPAAYPETSVPSLASMPAVDGFNGKLEAFGGGYQDGALGGVSGAFSIPLGYRFGAQVDGTIADIGGKTYAQGAGHLFWRDPTIGLIGLYGSYAHYDGFKGVDAYQAAAEGEYYMGRFTLRGIAGVEGVDGGSFTNGGGFLIDYGNNTRFFDKVDLVFYPVDDFKVYAGHRYTGGVNAAAGGAEYLWHLQGGTAASLFAEARIGEHDYKAAWAGIRFYFGGNDKTLIRRHREDDPNLWEPDTLFGIAAGLSGTHPVCPPPGEVTGDGLFCFGPR